MHLANCEIDMRTMTSVAAFLLAVLTFTAAQGAEDKTYV